MSSPRWTPPPGAGPLIHAHDHLIDRLIDDPVVKHRFEKRTERGKWACIDWTGSKNRGYGQIKFYGHQMVASRVAWILRHRGPIPIFMQIDHLCMNPGCVNPEHLDVVTAEENARRIMVPPPGWIPVRHADYPRRRHLRGVRIGTPPNPLFPVESAA